MASDMRTVIPLNISPATHDINLDSFLGFFFCKAIGKKKRRFLLTEALKFSGDQITFVVRTSRTKNA